MLNVYLEQQKNTDAEILLIFNDDEYCQGYGQIKEAFRALTIDDILNSIYLFMILNQPMLGMLERMTKLLIEFCTLFI